MGWLEDALAQQPDYVSQDPMTVMNQLTPTPPRTQESIDSSTGMLSKILDTGGKAVGILTHTLAAPLNVARLVDEGLRGLTGQSKNDMLIHQAVPNYAALYQQTAQVDPATGQVNPGPVGNLLNSPQFANVRAMVKKQVQTGTNPALAAGLLGDPTRDGMEIPTISENPLYALTGTITGERPARLAEIEAAGRVLLGGTKNYPDALRRYEEVNSEKALTGQRSSAMLENLAQVGLTGAKTKTEDAMREPRVFSETALGAQRMAGAGKYGAEADLARTRSGDIANNRMTRNSEAIARITDHFSAIFKRLVDAGVPAETAKKAAILSLPPEEQQVMADYPLEEATALKRNQSAGTAQEEGLAIRRGALAKSTIADTRLSAEEKGQVLGEAGIPATVNPPSNMLSAGLSKLPVIGAPFRSTVTLGGSKPAGDDDESLIASIPTTVRDSATAMQFLVKKGIDTGRAQRLAKEWVRR